MDRRTFLQTTAGVGIGAGLAGCLGSSAQPGGDYDVGMAARRYDRPNIEVTAGTTVVWRNTSSIAHTVTAREEQIPEAASFFASGGFDSESEAESAWVGGNGGALYQGETFEHEFTVPGEYVYFCIPHEPSGMAGVVTVTESGSDTATATES